MLWERIFRPRPAEPAPDVPAVAATHPSSYVDEIELALISAVYGAGGGPDEDDADPIGVRVVVDRWHRHRGCRPADSLPHVSGLDDHAFGRVLRAGATLGGRPRSCVVQDAADALVEIGVEHAADLRGRPAASREQLLTVRGLPPTAVQQLVVLLGVAGPDAAGGPTRESATAAAAPTGGPVQPGVASGE